MGFPVSKFGIAACGIGLLALTGASGSPSHRYGDWLLDQMTVRHPEIISIAIDVNGSGGPISVLHGASQAGGTVLPLANALGQPIGTVRVALGGGRADFAPQVATELGHRIYTADGLIDPDPFVPETRRSNRGQALIDRAVDRHPDIVTLAMHAAPDPGDQNRIIASSFGRIGKLGDKDDQHVVAGDATLTEVTNGGARVAIELPMHDRTGHIIGALSTSFRVESGASVETIKQKAVEVRDEIANDTPSLSWLKE